MRIILCLHSAELEGAPLQMLLLSRLLQKHGFNVELCSPNDGPILEMADEYAIRSSVIPNLYSADVQQAYIKQHILSKKPDIVMVNTILGARIVEHLHALSPELPVMWSIHESECHHIMKENPYITPEVFSLARAVIFVSDHTKSVYEQWNTGNMHVIPNGIDVTGIQEKLQRYDTVGLRERFGIPRTALVSTLIGSICPRKGQKEFVLAALEVLERLPSFYNAHFLIAGKLHPDYVLYLEEALQPAKDSGMIHQFHVLPEQKDPLEYYACSDIYVCNSFIESFPLVILEAMACELPIAASNSYGIAEQIIHNESGLLHLSGNSSQLAAHIYVLLTNKSLRRTLSHNAKHRVSSLFSEEKMLQQYSNLLSTLTENEVGSHPMSAV